jgi:hypothetical protein
MAEGFMEFFANYKKYSIIILALLIYGCDDTINQHELDSIVIPPSNVSFNKYIQPVFDGKCNNAGCHNGSDRASGLSLSNHASATSDFLIVAPGLPDNSKLVWAIEGRTTSIMPPLGYWPLTKNQREGIITWIREGAKNN